MEVLNLNELMQEFEQLQGGLPLDSLDSETHVKIMGLFRQILATPGLIELINVYMTEQR